MTSLGAQSIPTELAKLVGTNNVHLASPVASIDDHGSHITVTTRNDEKFTARKCILSIPSTMYKELNITPALPKPVQEVTNGTVLGDYNKAIVCYNKPWWRGEGFNGYFADFEGPVIIGRDTSVDDKNHYSLTGFVNGLPGRKWSRLPAHERRALVLHQIAKAFKVDINSEAYRPIEFFDQIWQHEEFSRGAWHQSIKLGTSPSMHQSMVSQSATFTLLERNTARSGKDIWRVLYALVSKEHGRWYKLCKRSLQNCSLSHHFVTISLFLAGSDTYK